MATGNKTVRKNFSQTIKNVVTRKASDTVILKYLNNSRDYKMGQEQTIASDHIVIGRDSTCEVRYADKYDTVSRIHASISKQGEDWELKNLSNSKMISISPSGVI